MHAVQQYNSRMEAIDSNHQVRAARKRQVVAATAVWVSVMATVLLYLLFGWLNVWRPHTFWWLLTTTVIALSVVASLLLMLIQLRGKDAIRAVAIFIFTLLPLVWMAAYLWSTINFIESRNDLRLNAPIRSMGVWVGSYFELEARWRYSRITEGEHVVLFDDGTNPHVDQMVAEMDQHIEEMSAVLKTPPAETKVRWVRGSLFGQSGRAIGAWAICGLNRNPPEVDSLDRHEVAHSVITLMCPVNQEMPMLFAEGWAETQSRSKPDKILELLNEKESGNALTLDQIIRNNYGGSTGPAYQYGGAFVWYLLDRFGGEKFVELYGGVRRDSFREDVNEITGVSWEQLESDFWTWLEGRREWAIATNRENAEATLFVVERETDRERWLKLLAAGKAAATSAKYPKDVALLITEKSDDWHREVHLVIEDDCLWKRVEQQLPTPDSMTCQIATPAACGYFHRVEGKVVRNAGRYSSPSYKEESLSQKRFWFCRNGLSRLLMVDLETMDAPPDQRVLIHSIEPEADSNLWKLCYSIVDSVPENTQKIEALVDPSNNFNATEFSVLGGEGTQPHHQFQMMDLEGTSIVKDWHCTDGDGNKTFEMTLSQLSPEIADETKQTVEELVASAEPDSPQSISPEEDVEDKSWGELLVSPAALAIAWPAMGLIFMAIDLLCDRIRWKAA